MSFFSKLTDKLDELNLGSSSEKSEKPRDREGYPSELILALFPNLNQQGLIITTGQSYPPPSQQYESSSHSEQSYPPQYGGSPAPPPSGGDYHGQRDGGYYSSPPPAAAEPTYAPPPDKPPIPAGWVPQFDQQYQRWYYYEQATGRSQWEAPGYNAGGQGEDRGWGSHGDSSHAAPGYGYSSHDSHGYGGHGGDQGYGHGDHGYGHSGEGHGEYRGEENKTKKKKDHSGLMMGAAGGLAVGAIGGALLANALGKTPFSKQNHFPNFPFRASSLIVPKTTQMMSTTRRQLPCTQHLLRDLWMPSRYMSQPTTQKANM